MIHVNIEPLDVFVKKEYLYDMDKTYIGQFVRGKIFAISSYPQEALSFQILLEDGCMFSYIPVQAIQKKDHEIHHPLMPVDLIYRNSPGENIAVTSYTFLQGDIIAYFKHSKRWLKGRYILTVDWYENNELFHLLNMDNGQFAFVPSHKMKFRSIEESFPPYKKLHQIWKL
jgi:hypothetical protein